MYPPAPSRQKTGPVDWRAHLAAAEAQARAVAMETAVRQLNVETAALGESRAALEQRYAEIQHNQRLIVRGADTAGVLVGKWDGPCFKTLKNVLLEDFLRRFGCGWLPSRLAMPDFTYKSMPSHYRL